MKIVSVQGSPRSSGNSTTIAGRFCATAHQCGANIETFVLNEMTYRGCQGCMACKSSNEQCVLTDDLTGVLQAVQDADFLLLSSPVYWGDVSSQLKGFIDRMYSFLTPDYMTASVKTRLSSGKELFLILTQEDPEEHHGDIFDRYKFFFTWLGFQECHLIRAGSVHKLGDINRRTDILEQAEQQARELFQQ